MNNMLLLPSVITEIGKCMIARFKREINYLVHYKRNIENLRKEDEKLKALRDDVQGLVDEAWRKGEQLNSVVQQWVSSVDLIQADARKLNDDGEEKKRCLSGMCPDWRSRYHLSKEATKMTLIVNELRTSGNFSHVSHPLPPPSIELAPLGDFEAFASTKLAMQQIIEALNDETIIIIGVCGMAGVGKTTLVNEVGKQLKREKLYNEVVVVTVSQNQDIPKIQGEIAEKLGMRLEHKSISVRASRLYERVKQETKILIILDDLWDRLELHEVGIPHGYVHKGCKILLTSRSVDVCNAMESDAKIEVGVLSEQDSWNLFKRKVGVVSESPTMQDLAKKVAKECEGLPLAIVTLGRTLRGRDKSYWTCVLQELKKSIP